MKGWVRIEVTLEDDRYFEPERRLILAGKSGEREATVESFRRQHGRAVLKFRGIDSIDDAEKLIGSDVRICTTDLLSAPEGSFYTFQLKGCNVYNNDEYLGTVTDVLDLGGPEILKVDLGNDETLIPFAQPYFRKIDIAGRRIDVDLPEGLRDINK